MDENISTTRTEEEKLFLTLFAKNLKLVRKAKGLSQEEMAHLTGFSRSYYTEIETGKRNISLINIHRLLNVLMIDANTLINNKNLD